MCPCPRNAGNNMMITRLIILCNTDITWSWHCPVSHERCTRSLVTPDTSSQLLLGDTSPGHGEIAETAENTAKRDIYLYLHWPFVIPPVYFRKNFNVYLLAFIEWSPAYFLKAFFGIPTETDLWIYLRGLSLCLRGRHDYCSGPGRAPTLDTGYREATDAMIQDHWEPSASYLHLPPSWLIRLLANELMNKAIGKLVAWIANNNR